MYDEQEKKEREEKEKKEREEKEKKEREEKEKKEREEKEREEEEKKEGEEEDISFEDLERLLEDGIAREEREKKEKKEREEKEKKEREEKEKKEREEKRAREEKEYWDSKFALDDLQRKKRRYMKVSAIVGLSLAVIFSLVFSLNIIENNYYGFAFSKIIFAILCGCLLGVVFAIALVLFINAYLELEESNIRRKVYEYEMKYIQEEVQDDVFENSVKMSSKYLNQYYDQTREQARKGFYVTVFVSVAGAFLIAVGIVAMFIGKTEPSYITCASGVITEFIAAIFFYLYNKTIVSMSKYHNKLVLSQNISIALKVADTLPFEYKTRSKNMIITELLKDINTYLIKNDSENDKE